MKQLYDKERDAMELDQAGGFYTRHVSAMTREQLHSKSDIAAELGHRDMLISELKEALNGLLTIYDDHSGKVWTTSSKRRALDAAHEAIKKVTG